MSGEFPKSQPAENLKSLQQSTERENFDTFLYYVRSGQFDIDFALSLQKQWNIPQEMLNSEEAREAALEGVTKNLSQGNIDEV